MVIQGDRDQILLLSNSIDLEINLIIINESETMMIMDQQR